MASRKTVVTPQQKWDSFPPNAKDILRKLLVAVGVGGSLQLVQHWFEENLGSLDALAITVDTQVDKDGLTALFLASYFGHVDIVRFLVEVCGSNVNLKEELEGRTPLIGAARGCETDCIRVLLELGADIGPRDDRGSTALDWARSEGSQDCIDVLEQWLPAPAVKSALKV